MDPITALGVASAVISFVDFAAKLVSETQKVYSSAHGTSDEEVTTSIIVRDIQALARPLALKNGAVDAEISNLALACQTEADALIDLLREIELQAKPTLWESFRKAFKSRKMKPRVREIESRILKLQNQLNSRLIHMMSDKQDAVLSRLEAISSAHTDMQVQSRNTMAQMMNEVYLWARKRNPAQSICPTLSDLTLQVSRLANEDRILSSLSFDELVLRYRDVKTQQDKTFQWMFDEPDDLPRTNFQKWLREQDGIFWIGGKPGSGKSTMMKYLSKHPVTLELLRQWAGPNKDMDLLVWFFWSAGSSLQRSQEGLLQSLLYQILRRCPDLIPTVCASRWDDSNAIDEKSAQWTREELRAALELLSSSQLLPARRFCLFIDGLDEYEGLPNEIIRMVQALAKSRSFKICVSSRKWNEFNAAFTIPNCDGIITLEQYTLRDIEIFVTEVLEKDESFAQAERKDERYKNFVREVKNKADGVFLWVYLVVNQLLKGLGEENRLDDLERKLKNIPPTLDEFFEQILDRIDKADQKPSARAFLLAIHAVQPLSVIAYHYLEYHEEATIFAKQTADKPPDETERQLLKMSIMKRLNYLCKDLLEAHEIVTDKTYKDWKVDFIHRTAKDFLHNSRHQQLVLRATENHTNDWNTYQTLCRIQLAQAKSMGPRDGIQTRLNSIFTLVDEFMFYALEVENQLEIAEVEVLEEFDRTITHIAKTDMTCHWTNARDAPKGAFFNENAANNFLGLAIQAHLRGFISQKLHQDPGIIRKKKGRPLLDYALRPDIVTPARLPHLTEYIDQKLVELLLDNGADPNEKVSIYGGITVWALFLLYCREKKTSNSKTLNTWYQVAEMMIRKGAARDVKLETREVQTMRIEGSKEVVRGTTAKYQQTVVVSGQPESEISSEIPIDFTAMEILRDLFGERATQLEAIIVAKPSRSWWNLFG